MSIYAAVWLAGIAFGFGWMFGGGYALRKYVMPLIEKTNELSNTIDRMVRFRE